ncbi:MAG: phosphoribosylanthranilate isomerase [Lachnospiraceae bacterium]|nr:phosphoribosylanthranilate isomerase [Lachnospiraceae bacterium]
MKIKICGLSRQADIEYANQLKPDYIGFVFYEKSRRYVTKEQAADLKRHLDPGIKAVGVFLDAPIEEVISLLDEGIIDLAQLHGEESEEDIRYIKAVTGREVIKAVRAGKHYEVEAWLDSAADYLLFDSGAGSGEVFDWSLLLDVNREYFLAGGLRTENIEEAAGTLRPFAIDLSSGVETDGYKDFEKMKDAVCLAHRLR